MALITCSECGKEYSNRAAACPNCGCPTEIAEPTTNDQAVTAPEPEVAAPEMPPAEAAEAETEILAEHAPEDAEAPEEIPEETPEETPDAAENVLNEATMPENPDAPVPTEAFVPEEPDAPVPAEAFMPEEPDTPAPTDMIAPVDPYAPLPAASENPAMFVPAEAGAPDAPIAKKKTGKIILIAAIAAVAVIAAVVSFLLIKNYKEKAAAYAAADELYQSGDYEAAKKAFTELDGFSDAEARVVECENSAAYAAAEALYEKEDYEAAQQAFEKLDGFSDAADRVADCADMIEKGKDYDRALRYMTDREYEDAWEIYDSLGDYKDAADRASFCDAVISCSKGNYSSAYELLKEIPEFEGTKSLLMQMYYETRLFEGLNDMRRYMKNPDSLSLLSAETYYNPGNGVDPEKVSLVAPSFVIRESGQNGWGGYSTSYCYINCDDGKYEYYGSCDTLDYSDADNTTELYTCLLIKACKENCKVLEEAIDFERVSALVSSGDYTKVKVIPELVFDDFSELLDIPADGGV